MAYGMSMKWRLRVDAFLETVSWDDTWSAMNQLIAAASVNVRKPNVMAAG